MVAKDVCKGLQGKIIGKGDQVKMIIGPDSHERIGWVIHVNPEETTMQAVRTDLSVIPRTKRLTIVYNNTKDEAKNCWNHRDYEFNRELRMHKQRAEKLHVEGKIAAPTVKALITENPQFHYQDDDKVDHSIEYVDVAMYPDDAILKRPESLNPFWKQISNNLMTWINFSKTPISNKLGRVTRER